MPGAFPEPRHHLVTGLDVGDNDACGVTPACTIESDSHLASCWDARALGAALPPQGHVECCVRCRNKTVTEEPLCLAGVTLAGETVTIRLDAIQVNPRRTGRLNPLERLSEF